MLRFNKVTLFAALFLGLLTGAAPLAHVSAVSAADWRPGRIVDDTVFMNKNDMSISQIQQFLESKMPSCDTNGNGYYNGVKRSQYGSGVGNPAPFTCLRDYKEVPKTTPGNWIPDSNYGRTDGSAPAGSKSAAEIIWDAAQAYNINPKVLLVTLQKESGLVTDDWPLKRQLVYAMGAHCPDSGPGGSANCDVNYSGFSMQMRESAELFRYYLDNMDQPWWSNKKPFQNNYIQYDVDSSCGGSNILMETRATTALYVYTPYQPNSAALAAGYGSAEPCGAYGNRNFWLYYNDWFGTTLDKSFLLVKSSANNAQYVIYNNLKQYIPSTEVKVAWGLDSTPMETVDQAYLDSLVTGPNLDTVFRINSGNQLYVADSGKRYAIPTVEAWKSWKLDSKAISNVPTGLGITPADGGTLSYTVRQSGQGAVYMLDGLNNSNQSILRRYANPDVLYGIEGDGVAIITVSSSLFSTINSDIRSDVTSTKMANGGQEYQISSGYRLPETVAVASLYPGVAANVTSTTIGRFILSVNATPFVKVYNAAEVYVVQSGSRYHIASPEMLDQWVGDKSRINIVNQSFMNTLTNANQSVTSSVATNTDGTYLLSSGSKALILPALQGAYQTSSSFNTSASLMNALPTTNTVATRFVRNAANGQISLLDNSSRLNIISSIPLAESWGATGSSTVTLPSLTIDDFSVNSQLLSAHVSDGTDSYAPVGGVLRRTTATNASWKLPSAQAFSDGTLSTFTTGGDLPVTAYANGLYYRLIDGRAYASTDPKIAAAWGISTASVDLSRIINMYTPGLYMLTPLITYGGYYYVADSGNLYKMNQPRFSNLGLNSPLMSVDPSVTGSPITEWTSPIFKNSQGGSYVVDGGTLRTFNHILILNHWTSGVSPIITVSDNFISMFRLGKPIERAIKADNSPKIYSAESATKRWITSGSIYSGQYAPYTNVNQSLIDALPDGANL